MKSITDCLEFRVERIDHDSCKNAIPEIVPTLCDCHSEQSKVCEQLARDDDDDDGDEALPRSFLNYVVREAVIFSQFFTKELPPRSHKLDRPGFLKLDLQSGVATC